MKLTHLKITFCVLRSEAANKKRLISLYQKCITIRAIECYLTNLQLLECSSCQNFTERDPLLLSCFPSLHYCNIGMSERLSAAIVLNVVNFCRDLKCLIFSDYRVRFFVFPTEISILKTYNSYASFYQQLLFMISFLTQFQLMVNWYM